MNEVSDSIEDFILPRKELSEASFCKNFDEYKNLYNKSIEDPQQFWREIAQQLYWKCPPKSVLDGNLDIGKGKIFVNFMKGGLTNASYNVLDRQINRGLGDNIAYYWEGNDGKSKRRITYTELRREVCKFANALKGLGIKKGDRIAIYMPVSIECVVAMLACARIGAVHSVIFSGFSTETLAERIIDVKCVLIISFDGCFRTNKLISLKNMTDSALDICRKRGFQKILNIVYKHLNSSSLATDVPNDCQHAWDDHVDIWWHLFIDDHSDICEPEWLDALDPLYILFTSGSTGKPKGIVHSLGGSLVYSYFMSKILFDIRAGDVFFSTSDLGWASAHIHTVYGGLANGATIVLMEGTPTFPNPDRLWEIIDNLKVNIFFTAPTVVRILMNLGDHYVKAYKRDSLKILGQTGEPITCGTWRWLWNVVGDGKCSIVDPYGQTETCGPMISPLPGCTPMKPGSATLPLFGIVPAVLNDEGIEIIGPGYGHLVYKTVWPGMALTIDGKHDLFESTYFQKFVGYYWTGDEVRRDADGYYWIMGRIDDTFNVSGHLLSAIEIENAITENRAVLEAVAVPAPHPIKGNALAIFVVLNNDYKMTGKMELDIRNKVRERIGALAEPENIVAVQRLPRNKSGKIMRRILIKILRNDRDLGDISSLEDKSVIFEIIDKITKL